MKPAGIVGIILIVIGLIGFAWGGLGWTTQKKDAQLGPLEITHKETHGITFPPVPSGICLVGGVLLVLWLLGLVSSYTLGGFIHLLLVIAIVVLIIQLISGRRPL